MKDSDIKIKTKHSEIMKYWEDKYISISGKVYNSVLRTRGEKVYPVVIIDKYEPRCFCCGKRILKEWELSCLYRKHNKLGDDLLNDEDITSKLHRHIIVDKKDTPDNLFLLCDICIKEAPCTNYRTFISWIYKNRADYNRRIYLNNL